MSWFNFILGLIDFPLLLGIVITSEVVRGKSRTEKSAKGEVANHVVKYLSPDLFDTACKDNDAYTRVVHD